ncbi:MAG: hypothetical protein SOT81_10935 [Treponema sp.]|nr:hypothetical protein [Treponema sp.]
MNYSIIFNKMTKDAFDKFIEINSLKSLKGVNKDDYKEKFIKYFEANPHAEIDFQNFYKRLEEAGRKHFYLFKLDSEQIKYKNLIDSICNIPSEDTRCFDPEQDNQKLYKRVEDNFILVKKIQIRKSYTFLGDEIKKDFLTKKYQISKVHYITFVNFDFKNKRIICGYDSCGDYSDKRKDDKELFEFLETVIGKQVKFESLLTSEHIDTLKYLPNCLAYSISNKANSFDFANFKKSKANFEDIKRDLVQQKYSLKQIKENNPDFDLHTNILYTAGLSKAIDDDFSLTNDNFEFYYFTDVTGKVFYFRMRFDVVESSIITFSESITKEELQDVFKQII